MLSILARAVALAKTGKLDSNVDFSAAFVAATTTFGLVHTVLNRADSSQRVLQPRAASQVAGLSHVSQLASMKSTVQVPAHVPVQLPFALVGTEHLPWQFPMQVPLQAPAVIPLQVPEHVPRQVPLQGAAVASSAMH